MVIYPMPEGRGLAPVIAVSNGSIARRISP
jgi:hypothetical protein